jgi:hypothetical protein
VTEQGAERARVEVWEQRDGAWRWRYVGGDGTDRIELPSNEPDESRDEAVHKASIAYPGLPVEVRERPRGGPREGHGRSGRSRRVPRVVFPALVAAATVALAVRRPRWWTLAPAAAAVATTVHRLRAR